MKDLFWMKRALLLANKAYKLNKIPIGAVLVFNNFEIGTGFNFSGLNFCPFYHAEIIAIKQGSFYTSNYFLQNSKLYVTLKPCIICKSCCSISKIKKIIFCLNCHNNNKINYNKKIKFLRNKKIKNELFFLIKKFFLKQN